MTSTSRGVVTSRAGAATPTATQSGDKISEWKAQKQLETSCYNQLAEAIAKVAKEKDLVVNTKLSLKNLIDETVRKLDHVRRERQKLAKVEEGLTAVLGGVAKPSRPPTCDASTSTNDAPLLRKRRGTVSSTSSGDEERRRFFEENILQEDVFDDDITSLLASPKTPRAGGQEVKLQGAASRGRTESTVALHDYPCTPLERERPAPTNGAAPPGPPTTAQVTVATSVEVTAPPHAPAPPNAATAAKVGGQSTRSERRREQRKRKQLRVSQLDTAAAPEGGAQEPSAGYSQQRGRAQTAERTDRRGRQEEGGLQRSADAGPSRVRRKRQLPPPAPSRQRPPRRKNMAVIVAMNGGTFADIARRVKETAAPDSEAVTGIRRTKAGDLLLELRGPQQKTAAETLQKRLEESGLTARRTVATDVLLVKGIDVTATKEDLAAAFSERAAADGAEDGTTVMSLSAAPDGTQTARVKVTREQASRLLAQEARPIRVGWSRCRVRRFVTVEVCFRCLGYGHKSRDCRSPVDRSKACLKCGKEGHKAKECKGTELCLPCRDRRLPDGHRAGSARCPAFQERLKHGGKTSR